MDVIIIGAGPAGVFAARRAAELGATTTLITRDEFGGMGPPTDQFRCGLWPMLPG
jgi:pyruvate/2-oxoglutarate dehydrogenase complex dihydrolipoamide dehydrogenase (E3) component